jgi:hypothetical protein
MCRLDRRHTGADTARKAVAMGLDPGDISTIEDEGSVDEARRVMEEMRAGITA